MTYTANIPHTPLPLQGTNPECPSAPKRSVQKKRRFKNYTQEELGPPIILNFGNVENINNFNTPQNSPRENSDEKYLWAPKKIRKVSNINGFHAKNLFGV